MDAIGSFFSSVAERAQTAAQTVKQRAAAHHEKFMAERAAYTGDQGAAERPVSSRLPWEGLGASPRAREAAAEVREAVLALSRSDETFTKSPPASAGWSFDLESRVEAVRRLMELDPGIESARFRLVPRAVDEAAFFSNLFYRADLARESARVRIDAEEEGAMAAAAAAAAAATAEADPLPSRPRLASAGPARPERNTELGFAAAGPEGRATGGAVEQAGEGDERRGLLGRTPAAAPALGVGYTDGLAGPGSTVEAAAVRTAAVAAPGPREDVLGDEDGGEGGVLGSALDDALYGHMSSAGGTRRSSEDHGDRGEAEAVARGAASSGFGDEEDFDLEDIDQDVGTTKLDDDAGGELDDAELEAAIAAELDMDE